VCAAPQFAAHDVDGGMVLDTDGNNTVRTAQPLFGPGPYYVVVHDFQDGRYAPGQSYALDLRLSPEPDPNDASPDPAKRNNFYDPYPQRMSDLEPNRTRAIDVTSTLMMGGTVKGIISYAADSDWYSFLHPCPMMDCGLQFEWVQPGPSPTRIAFIVWKQDLQTMQESWTYTGATPTTQLSGPVTDVFGDGDCHECCLASHKDSAADYRYYLQVRDVGADDWDTSAGGTYELRLKTVTPGCPAACSEGNECGCYCKALNMCPAGPML
jgi:hypothetical protein